MGRTAFVLGGGGLLGAAEGGMARALLERGIAPDLVLGTSVGAINGAALAAAPTPAGADRLVALWRQLADGDIFGGSLVGRVVHAARSRTALHSTEPLERLLRDNLPVHTFEQLTVEFACVAASIERAREHWFDSGDVIRAVLASSALPGVFPPVAIDGEHYVDGGLVNSIPLSAAVARGATTIWVLHVGRIEQPLHPPRSPWEAGFVAFEIARRHRFHADLAAVPEGVEVHVLPTGRSPARMSTWSNLRYRDVSRVGTRSSDAYDATVAYLDGISTPAG